MERILLPRAHRLLKRRCIATSECLRCIASDLYAASDHHAASNIETVSDLYASSDLYTASCERCTAPERPKRGAARVAA